MIVYVTLVGIIADLGLQTVFIRDASRDRTVLARYLGNLLSARLLLSLLVLVILAGALRLLSPSLFPYTLAAFVLLLTTSYSSLLRAVFYIRGRLGYEAIAIVATPSSGCIPRATFSPVSSPLASFAGAGTSASPSGSSLPSCAECSPPGSRWRSLSPSRPSTHSSTSFCCSSSRTSRWSAGTRRRTSTSTPSPGCRSRRWGRSFRRYRCWRRAIVAGWCSPTRSRTRCSPSSACRWPSARS